MGIDAQESLYTKQQLRDIARAARMELARRSLINFTKSVSYTHLTLPTKA